MAIGGRPEPPLRSLSPSEDGAARRKAPGSMAALDEAFQDNWEQSLETVSTKWWARPQAATGTRSLGWFLSAGTATRIAALVNPQRGQSQRRRIIGRDRCPGARGRGKG